MDRYEEIKALDLAHTSAMTAAEAASYLNETLVEVNIEVAPSVVFRILQDADKVFGIQLAAATANVADAAVLAAIKSVYLFKGAGTYGNGLRMWAGQKDLEVLDGLLTHGYIDVAQYNAIKDACTDMVSIAKANGVHPVVPGDIEHARELP